MAARLKIWGAAMPTTAAMAPLSTGTTIKTLIQLKPFLTFKIVAAGISFDGSIAATPIKVELLDTGTVFATVTASVDADITKMDSREDAAASVQGLTLGTGATGYNASAEGTITSTNPLDVQFVAPTNQYYVQFPLGREPKCIIGTSVRLRVTAPVAVNCYPWIEVEF